MKDWYAGCFCSSYHLDFNERKDFNMKKKVSYTLVAMVSVSVAILALLIGGLGPDTTPMAKFFLVFFGAIIVLQGIPALLLFVCMVRELFFGPKRKINQPVLVETKGEHSIP